jgi:hypothetical protein
VAIEFDNVLTAGTVLIRSDIRSQNFVQGSAGWRIESDGDAEFNSIIIRGSTVVGGTALYYSGTPAAGNLVAAIAGAASTDSFGNPYGKGLTIADSGFLSIYNSSDVLTTLIGGPNATVKTTASNGSVVTMTPSESVLGGAGIDFTSPVGDTGSLHVGPGAVGANIMMESEKTITGVLHDAYVSVYPNAGSTLSYGVGANLYEVRVNDSAIVHDAPTVTMTDGGGQTDFFNGAVDQGRGIRAATNLTGNVTFGATETAILTLPSMTFIDGRAYRVKVWGLHQWPTTDNYALYRLRKTNTAGTIYKDQMRIGGVPVASTNSPVQIDTVLTNSSGANVTAAVLLTGIQGSVAQTWTFAASGGNVASMTVEDIGSATDWPGNAIT